MTVITKPLTGEKKDKAPLVLPVHPQQQVDPEVGGKPRLSERHYHILRQRAAGNRAGQWLVMFMIGLFMFFIICGIYFVYQGMTSGRHQKWRGWCNVPYYKESPQSQQRIDGNDLFGYVSPDDLVKRIDNDGLYGSGKDPDAESLRSFFREEFEIDLDEEKYSKIEVPDFKNGRLGRFIHEFDSNKTAIVDQTGMRCFIMPLDRKQILPPRSMYDMIEKMWKGYYSVNTQRVRESMRVVQPPLDDLSDLGEYIQQECEDKVTYRLEKATDRIVKRSVEGQKDALPFTEFTGLYQIEYDIVNLDQLEKH